MKYVLPWLILFLALGLFVILSAIYFFATYGIYGVK